MSKLQSKSIGQVSAAWLPPIAYMGLIYFLSSQSDLPSMPSGLLSFDKFQHASAYLVFGLLLYRAVLLVPLARVSLYVQAFSIASLYGMSDELHQSFVPHRSPDYRDWIADSIGTIFGLLILYIIRRQIRYRRSLK